MTDDEDFNLISNNEKDQILKSDGNVGKNKFKCKGCGMEMTKTKLKNHLTRFDSCRKEYEEKELENLKQPTKRVRKDYQKLYYCLSPLRS